MNKTLIIFTRNEIEGVKQIFDLIPMHLFDEVFAMDGQSTDGTVEYLEERGVRVYRQRKLGRVNALREAMQIAQGEAIVFLSSDGNEDPRDIPKLLELIEGNDMVLASRFLPNARSDDSDDPLLLRRTFSIIVTRLVNLIWRTNLADALNGLRAIRRSLWERTEISPGYHTAEFQLTVQAAKLRSRIAEVPTIEGLRIGHLRYASTLRIALSLCKVFLKELATPMYKDGSQLDRTVKESVHKSPPD
jgi:glycosyltransferase involved in cell wall biosynthesis